MVKWRVIPVETLHPYMNVALEEVAVESVKNTGIPIIRFYLWDPAGVIIGQFQSMHDEVDVELCRQKGIVPVRRLSGGGAVYNDQKCLTYSVILPESMCPGGIHESYRVLCQPIIDALELLGLKGEFKPINDVILNGKKISGNAQLRKNGIIVHHGTLIYSLDVKNMFSVLKIDKRKISDKELKNVEDRVTSLLQHKDISLDEFHSVLVKAFTNGKEFFFDKWTDGEIARANELIEKQYSTDEWNFRR